MEWAKIPTSPEVWAVIKARHHEELRVFSSFSSEGDMRTAYGFEGHDFPIMEARTTWEADSEKSWNRLNEKHEYWLCTGKEEKP